MTAPAPDDALLARVRGELYAAVLSDVLDSHGRMRQALPPWIRPLDEVTILFGRARTGLYAPLYAEAEGRNPYALEIALIDDLRPGEVAVLACDGPTERIAPWGELLTTASRARGAAGCLTDGLVRDVRRIRELGFPLFHGGIGPLDTKGRAEMIAQDVPVEIGGVRIAPGDWIFGDADGVVIVPADLAGPVFADALRKVEGENTSRSELERGDLLATVFARHGIL